MLQLTSIISKYYNLTSEFIVLKYTVSQPFILNYYHRYMNINNVCRLFLFRQKVRKLCKVKFSNTEQNNKICIIKVNVFNAKYSVFKSKHNRLCLICVGLITVKESFR